MSCKKISLQNFNLYVHNSLFKADNLAEAMKGFGPSARESVLQHLNLTVGLKLNNSLLTGQPEPQIEAKVLIAECRISLSRERMKVIAAFLQSFKARELRARVPAGTRPRESPKDNPRAWWQFAVSAIRSDLAGFRERGRLVRSYLNLYRLSWLRDPTEVDAAQLTQLEADLPLEVTRSHRSCSWTAGRLSTADCGGTLNTTRLVLPASRAARSS